MLGEAFSLVGEKEAVMGDLVERVVSGEIEWDLQLPATVLIFLMEKLLEKVQLN